MRFSIILVGLAAVAAVACGGSDDEKPGSSAPGKVDSGIPASTPAGSLTDAQAADFCKSAAAAAATTFGSAEAKGALCGFTAYAFSSLGGDDAATACKTIYDECVKAPGETTEDECMKPSAACTATVGELEACFNDSMAQFKQSLSSLPGCDDVGKMVEEPMTDDSMPASCAVVEQKCPEALNDIPDPSSMLGG
jgi:hypothetical protein